MERESVSLAKLQNRQLLSWTRWPVQRQRQLRGRVSAPLCWVGRRWTSPNTCGRSLKRRAFVRANFRALTANRHIAAARGSESQRQQWPISPRRPSGRYLIGAVARIS